MEQIKVTLNSGEEVFVSLNVPNAIAEGDARDESDCKTAYINNWLNNNMTFAVEWEASNATA